MSQNCLRIQRRILLQMSVWLWSRLAGNGKWLRSVAILFFDAGLRPLLWSDPIKCWISILHQKKKKKTKRSMHSQSSTMSLKQLRYEDTAITQQQRAIETRVTYIKVTWRICSRRIHPIQSTWAFPDELSSNPSVFEEQTLYLTYSSTLTEGTLC